MLKSVSKCVSTLRQYFLYADDILLIALSVSTLQTLEYISETKLTDIDISISVKKSVCYQFGFHFNVICENITSVKRV